MLGHIARIVLDQPYVGCTAGACLKTRPIAIFAPSFAPPTGGDCRVATAVGTQHTSQWGVLQRLSCPMEVRGEVLYD